MKKLVKIIFISLLVIIISLGILWLIMSGIRQNNKKRTIAPINLVKERIVHNETDVFSGCFYGDLAIIAKNHQDYFIVKDNQVRVYDAINSETKSKYPNLPVDNEFVDFYWVLENCR